MALPLQCYQQDPVPVQRVQRVQRGLSTNIGYFNTAIENGQIVGEIVG